jgi:tyrosyl-tRNA synthetase
MSMDIIAELKWRGLLSDCTDQDALGRRLAEGPITLYCGFDPTADSLHVGNLIPLLTLRRFQLAGHHPIALAGGATGLIGDPSGKKAERQLLTREVLEQNIARQKRQLRNLLDFECPANPARLLDNASWIAPISYLDFLRDIGKHFTINSMVAKESVRSRMEDRECGISYTEFSYMLLQAFDFLHLRQNHHCELQIGGSDQWGNITAGIDLIRKKLDSPAYGLTLPLLTNPDGTKFGKTVAGAVWLDSQKTSVYRFYQFWIRTEDREVIKLLKLFTFVSSEEIEHLSQLHQAKPEARDAHRTLARHMTTLIHGGEATADAVRASEILFGGDLQGVTEPVFNDVVGEVPSKAIVKSELAEPGKSLVDLMVLSGLSTSKGQARKDIEAGGVYLNNTRETRVQRAITRGDLLFDKHLLLRKGKRNYVVISAAD